MFNEVMIYNLNYLISIVKVINVFFSISFVNKKDNINEKNKGTRYSLFFL